MPKKYLVVLSEAERARLRTLVGQGMAPARELTHARILLKANTGEGGAGWTDQAIAAALEVHVATVERVRQRFATQGLEAALERKPPERESRRTVDGRQEAHLVALEVVPAVSYETVRQVLKQTT